MTIYSTNPTAYHHDSSRDTQPKNAKNNNDDVAMPTASTSTTEMLTSDDNFSSTIRYKRNKILSLFPSSKNEVTSYNTTNKKWQVTEESNKKAQMINSSASTSYYNSPTTTSSSTVTSSTSSSSTIDPSLDSGMSRHNFKVVNPSTIPDYANLRKHFSKFHSKSKKQRSEILKNHLLPWLEKNKIHLCLYSKEEELEETGFWGLKNIAKENKELQFGRSILLKWWRALLNNMSIIEAEERSNYYDCILVIMSRYEFMDYDFIGSSTYQQWYKRDSVPHTSSVDEYRSLLSATLNYAIDKLNQKAIYSNMISFCATVLALSYFKIPGLASSLLQRLTIRPTVMKKLYKEMNNDNNSEHHQFYKNKSQCVFPKFLHPLMVSDLLSYQSSLASVKLQDCSSPLSLSGNWIRRWQSDDSELFFTFYRKYHSILNSYNSIVYPTISKYQLHQRNAILLSLPGYMYFASFFACKIDSLIHRELNSVTTLTCQQQQQNQVLKKVSFSPLVLSSGDNASVVNEAKSFMSSTVNGCNFSAKAHHDTPTGKPKALVMATKRYAECLVWCIVVGDPHGLYHDMLNVWLRFSIKRTVLTEAGEVYCMIDFLEQIIIELQKYSLKRDYFPVDIPFILHTLDIILSQSDHTTSLLRALTFIYVHFAFLTSHAALLHLLCNRIMLDTQNFERLLLHWGKNVRHFFLRCLMWRVGRVWHSAGIRWNSEAEQMMRTIVRKSDGTVASVCDGYACWNEWEKMSEANDTFTVNNNVMSVELLAYRKCSLEIHMSLEALMASFHRQHSSLQLSYSTLSHCSQSKIPVAIINEEGECVTPIPERIRKFSSQLAIPPVKIPSTTPATHVVQSFENNISPEKQTNSKMNIIHKRYKVSPITVKNQLVIKSRNSKERLFKLFNGSGNLDPTTPTKDSCIIKAKGEYKEEESSYNEYYTVSSPYTVSSSYLLPANTTDKKRRSLIQAPENQVVKRMFSKFSNDDHDTIDIDMLYNIEHIREHTPNYQQTFNMIKPYTTESTSSYIRTPEILTSSRNWKYHPSNHIYAIKVITDLRPILHEYCIWVEKNQASQSNCALVYVPRLALEWPKNWSYSQN